MTAIPSSGLASAPDGRIVAGMDERFAILPYQRPLNAVMRGILKVPGLARLPGRLLLAVHVVGRKTGREFDVPVAYTRDGEDLLIGTPFGWAANLVDGGDAEVRLLGRRTPVRVRRLDDEGEAITTLALLCRRLPTFAAFMKVRRAADGTPDADDVRDARKAGVKVFRLTPLDGRRPTGS